MNSDPALHSRIEHLETEVEEVSSRVDTHERALFGGLDPETNQRHVGVLEQLGDVVRELRKMGQTLDTVGKAAISWIGRLSLLILMGLGTVVWYLIVHWAAFAKAFASQ